MRRSILIGLHHYAVYSYPIRQSSISQTKLFVKKRSLFFNESLITVYEMFSVVGMYKIQKFLF